MVHDLIHIRDAKGWQLLKSAYPKQILPIDEICEELASVGFDLEFRECLGGLHTLGLVRR